jgi:hypothetical protein
MFRLLGSPSVASTTSAMTALRASARTLGEYWETQSGRLFRKSANSSSLSVVPLSQSNQQSFSRACSDRRMRL